MTIAKLAALAGFGMLALSAVPAEARPWSGYAIDDVNERAGPSTLYPSIVVIPAGAPILIYGCLGDYSWCDVSWGPYRGWMAADYLETTYGSQAVPLPEYIAPLGIPLITFEFDNYWGDYYRDEPFYRDSYRWRHFHPDHNPPPPPPHGFFPPPGGHYGQYHHDFDHHPPYGQNNFDGKQGYQPPLPPPHGPDNFDGPPKPHNFYKPYNGNGQFNGQYNGNSQPNGQFGNGKPPRNFGQQGYDRPPHHEDKPGCVMRDGRWNCDKP